MYEMSGIYTKGGNALISTPLTLTPTFTTALKVQVGFVLDAVSVD